MAEILKLDIRKSGFTSRAVNRALNRCLGRFCNISPGMLSRKGWTKVWMTRKSVDEKSCFKREVGGMTSRSLWLSTFAIIWLCVYIYIILLPRCLILKTQHTVKTWHLASTVHDKVRLSASLTCPRAGDFWAFVGRTPGFLFCLTLTSEKIEGGCMVCSGSREVQCHLKAQGISRNPFQGNGWPIYKVMENIN